MEMSKAEQFMVQAIKEGRKARDICAPNPPVGCVLVCGDQIVARGHTNRPGEDHAEAMALRLLSCEHDSVTAFVTLEPCSFHGRTPSCAHALIRSSVNEVYVGIVDPDPRNNGKGIEILKSGGLKVHVGLLSQTIKQELGPYLYAGT